MTLLKYGKIVILLVLSFGLISLFQACGDGFKGQVSNSSNNSSSEDSERSYVYSNPAESESVINSFPSNSGSSNQINSIPESSARESVEQKSITYNIVAGTQGDCELLVEDKLGQKYSCVRGGGCGVSCGIPGANCISANLPHFGLCVEVDRNQNIIDISEGSELIKTESINQLFNFVAGDKQTCERSILTRLGISRVCTRGGGCGDCGMPSNGCPSGNPTHFGACIRF